MLLIFLLHSELIDCCLAILLSWLEDHGWEVCTVWRIWEVLCFEANSRATWRCAAVLNLEACQEVACIDLNTRLCCPAFHGTSTLWFLNTNCE